MASDRELLQEAAYVICDDSMDIADRGGIPADVWESAMDAAEALHRAGMLISRRRADAPET